MRCGGVGTMLDDGRLHLSLLRGQILNILMANPAAPPPSKGPIIGTSAYPQSDGPLPAIGRMAWAMRGPRSRAGLIAYPVGPPSDSPIPQTRQATRYGPYPGMKPVPATAFEKIAPTTKTRMKVPIISLTAFMAGFRIAGPV